MNKSLLVEFYGNGTPDPRSVGYAWRDVGVEPRWRWEDFEDESSGPLPKPLDIKQFFLEKRQPENSEFDFTVSGPSHLYHWLRSNDATQLLRLTIFGSAGDMDTDACPTDHSHRDTTRGHPNGSVSSNCVPLMVWRPA